MEISKEDYIKAVNDVVKQGCFGYDSVAENCAYYGKDGSRCVIGHLLFNTIKWENKPTDLDDDDDLFFEINALSSGELCDDLRLNVKPEDRKIMTKLQMLHDDYGIRSISNKDRDIKDDLKQFKKEAIEILEEKL